MRSLILSLICIASCPLNSANRNPNSLNSVLYSGDYEFFDLTHGFDENTNYWPGVQRFVFTKKEEDYRSGGSWYAAKEFSAGEHGGTHIDAPYHFSRHGIYVADIPLQALIVPLYIVDISQMVENNSHFTLYDHHMQNLLSWNIDKPSLLIFKFGWSRFYPDRKKYYGIDETTNILNFPGLSTNVVNWCLNKYPNIIGFGVDTASVDPGYSKDFPVHLLTASRGLYQIENVKLDTPIPSSGCTALVMPMKITEGSGAPVRLVAICRKHIAEVPSLK